MTILEYRIESIPLQEEWFGRQAQEFQRFLGVFNQIGSEGWELVSYQACRRLDRSAATRRGPSSWPFSRDLLLSSPRELGWSSVFDSAT